MAGTVLSHCVAQSVRIVPTWLFLALQAAVRMWRDQAPEQWAACINLMCGHLLNSWGGAAGNVGNLPMVLVAGLCSDAAGQLLPLRPSADACAEARAWCCASLLR